jgi:hypothetical protein
MALARLFGVAQKHVCVLVCVPKQLKKGKERGRENEKKGK